MLEKRVDGGSGTSGVLEVDDESLLVTGRMREQEQDSRERWAGLERRGFSRKSSRTRYSGTRGNDCILDRRSKIQDVA